MTDYVSKIAAMQAAYQERKQAYLQNRAALGAAFDAVWAVDFKRFRLREAGLQASEDMKAWNVQFRDTMKSLIDRYNWFSPIEKIDLSVDIEAFQMTKSFEQALFDVAMEWLVASIDNETNGYVRNEVDDEVDAFIKQFFNP